MNGNDKLFGRVKGLLVQEGRRVHSLRIFPYLGWSPKTVLMAAKAFEDAHIKKTGEGHERLSEYERGVHVTRMGWTRIYFTFYGVEFSFNPVWPVLGAWS